MTLNILKIKKGIIFPTLNELKNSLSRTSGMDGLSVPFSDNNIT